MKKLICALICVLLVLSVCSCDKLISKIKDATDTKAADTESAKAPETEDLSNRFVYEGVSVELPEGFEVKETSGVTTATYKDYPLHADNITFVKSDDKISEYSESALRAEFEKLFGNIGNYSYEKINIGGYEVVVTKLDFEYLGVSMHESIYTCFLNSTSITVTYASVSGDFDHAFDLSAASLRIEK